MTHIIYVLIKYCRTSTALWSGALGHQAKEVKSQVMAIQTPVVQCGIRRGVWSPSPSHCPETGTLYESDVKKSCRDKEEMISRFFFFFFPLF